MTWISDVDPDRQNTKRYVWQPVIMDEQKQIIVTLPLWFKTKEICDEFIREELIPNTRSLNSE